jgi:hypothetical protein
MRLNLCLAETTHPILPQLRNAHAHAHTRTHTHTHMQCKAQLHRLRCCNRIGCGGLFHKKTTVEKFCGERMQEGGKIRGEPAYSAGGKEDGPQNKTKQNKRTMDNNLLTRRDESSKGQTNKGTKGPRSEAGQHSRQELVSRNNDGQQVQNWPQH